MDAVIQNILSLWVTMKYNAGRNELFSKGSCRKHIYRFFFIGTVLSTVSLNSQKQLLMFFIEF